MGVPRSLQARSTEMLADYFTPGMSIESEEDAATRANGDAEMAASRLVPSGPPASRMVSYGCLIRSPRLRHATACRRIGFESGDRMTYSGHVRNGQIALDEPARLP